ncbi:MAG: hypothetical protein WC624_00580 [Candidatus Margulisiibacteriota bacterium]
MKYYFNFTNIIFGTLLVAFSCLGGAVGFFLMLYGLPNALLLIFKTYPSGSEYIMWLFAVEIGIIFGSGIGAHLFLKISKTRFEFYETIGIVYLIFIVPFAFLMLLGQASLLAIYIRKVFLLFIMLFIILIAFLLRKSIVKTLTIYFGKVSINMFIRMFCGSIFGLLIGFIVFFVFPILSFSFTLPLGIALGAIYNESNKKIIFSRALGGAFLGVVISNLISFLIIIPTYLYPKVFGGITMFVIGLSIVFIIFLPNIIAYNVVKNYKNSSAG